MMLRHGLASWTSNYPICGLQSGQSKYCFRNSPESSRLSGHPQCNQMCNGNRLISPKTQLFYETIVPAAIVFCPPLYARNITYHVVSIDKDRRHRKTTIRSCHLPPQDFINWRVNSVIRINKSQSAMTRPEQSNSRHRKIMRVPKIVSR